MLLVYEALLPFFCGDLGVLFQEEVTQNRADKLPLLVYQVEKLRLLRSFHQRVNRHSKAAKLVDLL